MAVKKKQVKQGTSKAQAAVRRKLFVEAYIGNGGNATQAALAAGFPKKGARSRGHELVKDRHIAAEIAKRQEKHLEMAGLDVQRTLREVARIAYFDPRRLFGPDKKLKHVSDMDEDTAAVIASIEVEDLDDEKAIGRLVKTKLWDKNQALEKAMKHHGLYREDNKQQQPTIVHPPGVRKFKFQPYHGRQRGTAR